MNPSQATTIVNARVFDGARLRDWTSVRFADGIITDCATGPTAQDGDEVIDAEGGTILPGLIDSHLHLVPGDPLHVAPRSRKSRFAATSKRERRDSNPRLPA